MGPKAKAPAPKKPAATIAEVVAHLELLGHKDAAAEVLDKFGEGAVATATSPDPYGAANMPIYQTATFAQASATEFGDFDYTRSGNPTRSALQSGVADAEAARTASLSTGMAALSAVKRLCKAGDEVLLSDDSYGGTYRLLAQTCKDAGVAVKYVAMDGPEGPGKLEAAMTEKVSLVMVESPTNPMQRVCDLRGLAKVAHAHGALLEVDNTLMSPLLQKPLQLGADIVVHSATVRASREFPEDIVRVCVGIEDADDLIADLDQAFASYRGKSWFS
ncbi:cystathionine gamma-synthase [Aureococcus anophagefferens]|nr:cystathionine gamma-synthase [Aureococcus anophagefferens]